MCMLAMTLLSTIHRRSTFGVSKISRFISRNFSCSFVVDFFLLVWNGLGIGCGAHRLWTHRAYKAKLPLRIFLAIGQSIAGQNCIYIWSRDHRIHHKYSDTNADPHNVRRGFFFSHVGWLMTKKHPEVKEKGQKIDLSDLRADPVVKFQER